MKFLLFCLPVFCLFLTACEKENISESTDIVGSWRLVESLADPGDGSGTFEPVDSDRQITFAIDGSYTSTGNLCNFSLQVEEPSQGLYFPGENRLEPEECFTIGGTPITYEQNGEELIISYLCIEPCQHKYRKE